MPFSDHPQPFEVRVQRSGGIARLVLFGELDLTTGEEFAAAFRDAALDSDAVLVDLRGLAFMDSTGIRGLMRAKALADGSGVRLAVLNGSGPPHRVLELAGVEDAIEMVDDESQLDPPLGGPGERRTVR